MEEVKAYSGSYSAEYGFNSGAQLVMVMRSGTNRYHGDIFEYVRNNVIDARSFFDQQKLKLSRHQFGARIRRFPPARDSPRRRLDDS